MVDWSHAFNPGFVRGNLRALTDSQMRFVFAIFGAVRDGADIIAAKAAFIDGNPLATLQVAMHPAPGLSFNPHTLFVLDPHAGAGCASGWGVGK